MFHKLIKGLAPVAALAIGAMAGGCDGANIRIGDKEGVPLAELDRSGPAPTKLVLAGPDNVIVTDGDTLDIDVSGDQRAVDALRFTLDDDTLGIMREKTDWKGDERATVRVTMPSPSSIVLAGSGTIEAASLRGEADLMVAGSGTLRAARVAAQQLDVTIAGSGSLDADGSAEALDLTVAGSGTADMAGLKVQSADVTIAGSGEAEFASDGTVEANIMGSGTVTVHGRANCTVKSMGSGTLNCREGTGATTSTSPRETPEAPEAPQAPQPPQAPSAPE